MKNEHASRRLALGLCLGLVIGVDSAPVSADPDPNWADDGRWIPPQPNDPDTPPQEADYCWPAGAIHLVHIPYRDPQSQKLVCRMLVWYAPGCEDVDDGDSDCGTTPEVGISPRLWNPVDGTYISLQSPTVEIEPNVEREVLQFCNGHAALKDGRIVVIGGGGCGCDQISDQTLIFDPTMIPASSSSQDDPWSTGHVMNHKRWYPSATTLADGRILATSGSTTCSDYSMVLTPELYDPALDEWMEVDVDNLHLNFYPYMFVLPSMYIQGVVLPSQTRLAMAGPGSFSGATYPGLSTMTLTLDLSGSTPAGTWASVATHSEVRLYGAHGSAVMFQPGQILKAGGYNIGLNLPGTQTPDCGGYEQAGIIKFVNDNGTPNTSLGWSEDSSLDMFNPRKDHNLVILADGRVAAIGGSANCDPIDPANPGCDPEFEDCHECLLGCVPVYIAEWIDPTAGTLAAWDQLAAAHSPRSYHSTAALLPDGTILACGGDRPFDPELSETPPSARSAEIFMPPYLFDEEGNPAPRPVIDSVQYDSSETEEINYGQTFQVVLDDEYVPVIKKVHLIRLSAVTHGFDENQLLVPMEYDQDDEVLTVKAPRHPSCALPGYYMLFVVSNHEAEPETPHDVPSVAVYVLLDGCREDLNGDGYINGMDVAILLGEWESENPEVVCDGEVCCPYDLDGDGLVKGTDLAIILGGWSGQSPYPRSCVTTESMAMMSSSMSGGGGEESEPEPSGEAYQMMLEGLGIESYEQLTALLQMLGPQALATLVEQVMSQ